MYRHMRIQMRYFHCRYECWTMKKRKKNDRKERSIREKCKIYKESIYWGIFRNIFTAVVQLGSTHCNCLGPPLRQYRTHPQRSHEGAIVYKECLLAFIHKRNPLTQKPTKIPQQSLMVGLVCATLAHTHSREHTMRCKMEFWSLTWQGTIPSSNIASIHSLITMSSFAYTRNSQLIFGSMSIFWIYWSFEPD